MVLRGTSATALDSEPVPEVHVDMDVVEADIPVLLEPEVDEQQSFFDK